MKRKRARTENVFNPSTLVLNEERYRFDERVNV